jgi:hypothetical protein
VNWVDFLNSLQLEQEASFYEQVELQALLKNKSLVFDLHGALLNSRYVPQFKFSQKALLIDAFDQPWPHHPMDLDRSPDHFARQAIGITEESMHFYNSDENSFLQKETKETKKS